ncbi:tetratricopeptide repeat protein [Streptomyces sp. CA-132043]|uniref:tetratricopeptide repeat protein n=1 Tax=Streptomyces sp. CA-132043 TaxID=3240048 RepID=UPI003D937E68
MDDAFTGREPLLRELDRVRGAPPGDCRNLVLCGLGGCGKTTVAIAAARSAARNGVEAWWVSAATRPELHDGMRQVAVRLGADDAELTRAWSGMDSATDLLWRMLGRHPRPWLLVVDNADDPELLAAEGGAFADGTGWLRPVAAGAGTVLVTSRHRNPQAWGAWWRLRTVGPLTRPEATRVLMRVAGPGAGTAVDAAALADRLGRLPLALRLAGAQLAAASGAPWPDAVTTFDAYGRQLAAGGWQQLLEPEEAAMAEADRAPRRIVSRTWELSLDHLARRGMPEARELLRLLSFFAEAPVPYALLTPSVLGAPTGVLPGLDGTRLWRVLRALADLHLVDIPESGPGGAPSGNSAGSVGGSRAEHTADAGSEGTDETPDGDGAEAPRDAVRLHPLVRAASRLRGEATMRQAAYLEAATDLLVSATQGESHVSPEDPARWPLWQAITPHAQHLLRETGAHAAGSARAVAQAVRVAVTTGRALRARGLYGQAEETFAAAFETGRRVLGEGHDATLTAHHEVAAMHHARGRLAEADAGFRDLVRHRSAALGPDHPQTLLGRHMLAYVRHDQGRLTEAEAEYRAVLRTRTRVLGEADPLTMATRYRVARVLCDLGRPAEAETEYAAVLALRTEVFGAAHPRTLIVRRELARLHHDMGRPDLAGPEFEEVIAVQRRVLGNTHRDTLLSRSCRARLWQAQGRTTRAAVEFREVLRDLATVMGEDHPYTVTARRYLAEALDEPTGPPGTGGRAPG